MTPAAKSETTNTTGNGDGGAWAKDKLFGLRLDQTFPATKDKPSDPFLLIAGRIDGMVPTDLGEARHVALLVQYLDENGKPKGNPFKVGTLASAIADKIEQAVPDDFPAIVVAQVVESRFNNDALVLQWVASTDPDDVYDEFEVGPDVLDRVDRLRPTGERIGF